MNSTLRTAIFTFLTCNITGVAFSEQITTRFDGDTSRLVRQGDERIEISFSHSMGLLHAPVKVRVDDRSFSFNGFYVEFNGERGGYLTKSVSAEMEKDSVRVTHLLEHPRLPSPIRVVVRVLMAESDRAVRFTIDTDNGERVHLDRL